ncbi:P-loop containing nucleoside triphosphate hydrolase protein [Cadophora sp. DSE1049]|nr:P-loop containing nucleoside triphosphate hydrolase protein [Cadophora sp. DSE1049]
MAQQDRSERGWGLGSRFSWGRGRGNTWSQGEPGRSHRGGRGGRAGRGGRGGRGGGGNNICRNFRTGYCSFGGGCRFSHDLTSSIEHGPSSPVREHIEITPERAQARTDYNSWKRRLKVPPTQNDTQTMEGLWSGALAILEEEDRDWTQMLPRDLDNDEYYGRQHIQTLMSMVAHDNGCREFVDLAHPFLLVMTHPALLHCLSVDTFVGNLYNYISGSNGTRAIPFFKRLSTSLVEAHIESCKVSLIMTLAGTLIAMSTAICEVLRREPRATFHDDLPDLVDSLENIPEITNLDNRSTTFQIIANRVAELRAMIARAKGLLDHPEERRVGGVSTTVVASTYPREIALPGDRHDNDRMDITKIKILPTGDEIRSNRVEFLPSTNPDQPHFLTDPAGRHLDTHFRLLRHDIFGVLKEALGGLLTAIDNDPTLLSNPKLNLGDVRIYSYPDAQIRFVSYDHRRGFEAQISFPQLPSLRRMPPAERRTWWEESRRLEEGTLLCFVSLKDAESSILLFTVSEKCIAGKDFNLSSENHQSTIAAKLATYNQVDMESVIESSCHNTRGALIEFPGVLLATFVPILENLQNMQRQSRLPFRQWILPERIGANRNISPVLDIPPPLYARGTQFTFSLNAILKNSDGDLNLSPNTPIDDPAMIDELEARTSLDRGQCRALVAALFREFAYIQGPPGTGKSYLGVHLMRVLLSCKSEASLGPIIVVCYTNHALDQFLEHLAAVGIEKIIRIGGRSQSTVLEGKNLSIVSQDEAKTGTERYLLATTYTSLEEVEKSISKQLRFLHSAQKRPEWANLKRHLAKGYSRIHAQFARVDEDGFKTMGKDPFDVWVRGRLQVEPKESDDTDFPLSVRELLQVAAQNVHRLPLRDRHRLVEYWLQEMREDGTNEVFELVKSAEGLCKLLSAVHDDVDRRVLQTADVIGVTTTGLAKKIATLRHVRCKVVICEEAGEVMEPHMLSALLPSVEHFIQIGDHQQLRAKVTNHNLSLESKQGAQYQLDRSQFERLSVGEPGRPRLLVAQLDVQRRMRPEISALIRETIYPGLVDHEITKGLPDVVGMRRNVFWLDHNNVEEGAIQDMHQKSHSNLWEVEFTYALVRHIVRQGAYKSSEIAVLTPYTGQLQKLRSKMRNEFEIVLSERDEEVLAKDGFIDEEVLKESQQAGSQSKFEKRPLERKKLADLLRIATVDNFQGEEAKIIIMSLVRSNKDQKVGFLRTTNRINVLLSRAQHGMYLIGNTDTYSNIPMWAKVLGMLGATDSVGKALGLCCPRHPDAEIQVRQPDDFARLSPEGGCQLACDRRLSRCGHRCQARCHSESMHQVFPCPQPCQRLHRPCGHGCKKATCGEDCGVCLVPLDNVLLPCSHSKDGVPCHQSQDTHQIKCVVVVEKRAPDCGHVIQTQCWRDVASETFSCPVSCEANLPCGHRCPGSCGHCRKKGADNNLTSPSIEHRRCTKVCGRRFATCNHNCQKLCHDGISCGLCLSPCEVRHFRVLFLAT